MPRSSQVGQVLQRMRRARGSSQLDLALRVGVSQRHLSCIETGRARPSQPMLLAILEALDVPLARRNVILVEAGFAPHYRVQSLADPEMEPLRAALEQLLEAHDPSPAMALDRHWDLVRANRGVAALLRAVTGSEALAREIAAGTQLNMLEVLLESGLAARITNRAEVWAALHRRLWGEALDEPSLLPRLEALERRLPSHRRPMTAPEAHPPPEPVLTTRFEVPGLSHELVFLSMFSTFGTPRDITAASVKIEHLCPADAPTRAFVRGWTL